MHGQDQTQAESRVDPVLHLKILAELTRLMQPRPHPPIPSPSPTEHPLIPAPTIHEPSRQLVTPVAVTPRHGLRTVKQLPVQLLKNALEAVPLRGGNAVGGKTDEL